MDATVAALVGLIITGFAITNPGGRAGSQLAHLASVGVLATFLGSFAFEARGGLKNLIRPDLVGILALYYLTLYEFLFPQPHFDANAKDPHSVSFALWAVIVGFIGIIAGRHLVPRGRQPFEQVMTKPVPPGWLVAILWGSFFIGSFHMLLATNFDLARIVEETMGPRFSQPWVRGRFGGWKDLIGELQMLYFLIPPIVGLMFGNRERYSGLNLLLAPLAYLWLLFSAFASGTRTILAAYLVTMLIAFTFSSPPHRRRQVLVVAAICGAIMVMMTRTMLEMRTVGLKRWLETDAPGTKIHEESPVTVDGNLAVIVAIAEYFPERSRGRYLGFEIPYLALVRPIPRALWPGKPTDQSVTINDVLQMRGLTIAATYIGEAYMSGGLFAVAIYSLSLGMLATFWNRLSSPKNSELGLLVYSAGFYAVTITMRSSFTLTTALLPCVAGILFGKYVLPKIRDKIKRRAVLPPRPRKQPSEPRQREP